MIKKKHQYKKSLFYITKSVIQSVSISLLPPGIQCIPQLEFCAQKYVFQQTEIKHPQISSQHIMFSDSPKYLFDSYCLLFDCLDMFIIKKLHLVAEVILLKLVQTTISSSLCYIRSHFLSRNSAKEFTAVCDLSFILFCFCNGVWSEVKGSCC